MSRAAASRRASEVGLLDYVLGATGAAMATYSTGMALSNPALGYFFTAFVLGGTFFSFFLNRSLSSGTWRTLGGFLYTAALITAVFVARDLNGVLPEEGFPTNLMIAGVLSWMLVFGSFFVWKDSTLLFQAVPAIALFGMVGTWDTFQGSVVAFFLFLLSLATLFARAHARLMLQQAKASGFLGSLQKDDEPTDEDLQVMQKGPWRWMAGPEWALASAAAVVVVSLIAAPILQESVKGVSEAVNISVPVPPRPQAVAAGAGATQDATIGGGPIQLSNTPVLKAKMDSARYLRARTYDRYTGRGWQNTYYQTGGFAVDRPRMEDLARTLIKNPVERQFEIEILSGLHSSLPAPGYVVDIDSYQLRQRTDGTIEIPGNATRSPRIRITSMMPADEFVPSTTEASLQRQRFLDIGEIRAPVQVFFHDAAQGQVNDWDRAIAAKRAIERQVMYNINAPAVPRSEDPVEHFLFQSKQGYCDLFASAMVQGARSLGIPARYVTGFLPEPDDKDGEGLYVVRAKHAHAWAELYFEEAGWVTFDATEGALAVEGGERGASNDESVPSWLALALWSGGIAALMVGGYFILRRIHLMRPVRGQREEAARLLNAFVSSLESKMRRPRLSSQTSTEFVHLLMPQLGDVAPSASRLNDQLVAAMFARHTPDPAELSALREQIQEFRKQLRALRVAS